MTQIQILINQILILLYRLYEFEIKIPHYTLLINNLNVTKITIIRVIF